MRKCPIILLLVVVMLNSFSLLAQRPEVYQLFPGPEVTVPVGGKVDLHVVQMDMKGSVQVLSADWTLNGKPWAQVDARDGKLAEGLYSGAAVYTAPQAVPAKNPVMVSVAFKLSDKDKTVLLLSCAITVTDVENYFSVNTAFFSDYFEFTQPKNEFALQSMGMVNFVNGQLHININGNWVKDATVPLGVTLVIPGAPAVGAYRWHYPDAPCVARVSAGNYKGQAILLASTDCVPNHQKDCQAITLEGSTVVTMYDEKRKILQGYFSGGVLGTTLQSKFYYGSVYGRFTVHLK
jgi:hypothetical protein